MLSVSDNNSESVNERSHTDQQKKQNSISYGFAGSTDELIK